MIGCFYEFCPKYLSWVAENVTHEATIHFAKRNVAVKVAKVVRKDITIKILPIGSHVVDIFDVITRDNVFGDREQLPSCEIWQNNKPLVVNVLLWYGSDFSVSEHMFVPEKVKQVNVNGCNLFQLG